MKPTLLYISILIAVGFICLSSCSRSARQAKLKGRNELHSRDRDEIPAERIHAPGRKTVVKMEEVNGVLQIPTEINGIPMSFIFDTGAGLISISETEAGFLYKHGKLTDDDIVGKADFRDANGDISEGTIIILRSVKIGDRVLDNVQASVVRNPVAPLLMGQSALRKFGKISIDNDKNEITFE